MRTYSTTFGARLLTVDELHEMIVNGTFRAQIEAIREAYLQGDKVKVPQKNGEEREMYRYEYLKSQLPLFVPMGNVRKRRKPEGFCNPTGLACIDIDHVPLEVLAEVRQKLDALTWVKERHDSSRGEGVHAIVNMGVIPMPTAEADAQGFVPYIGKGHEKAYEQEYKRRYAAIAQYLEQLLGVKVDPSCKDVLRGMYVSYDPSAFVRPDSELTVFEADGYSPTLSAATDTRDQVKAQEPTLATPAAVPTPATSDPTLDPNLARTYLNYHIYRPSGRHEWWIKWGQYLRYKGVGVTDLMAYQQLMSHLLTQQGLVLADDPLLRSSDEVATAMEWGFSHSETAPADTTPDQWLDGLNDDEELARLKAIRKPKALTATLASQPEVVVMPTICGVMPLMMTYATHAKVEYCDGKQMRLNAMSVIVAQQGGLKSGVKDAIGLWKKSLLQHDNETRRLEDEFKEQRKAKQGEELPPPPKRALINIVPTISCSTLLKRMKQANGRHLYHDCEEIDTISKTNSSGSWSSKYDVYRLSFENGEWGQDYNSDQAESGLVNVAYNWTNLGTPNAVARCFAGNGSVENGLAGRVHFAVIPPNHFAHMPKYKATQPEHIEAIDRGVKILQMAQGLIDTPKLRKAIEQWCNDRADEAAEHNDLVLDTFRKRTAIIGFRAGVVFHILEQGEKWLEAGHTLTPDFMADAKESKHTIAFALLMADHALKYQCALWGGQLMEDRKCVIKNGGKYNSRNTNLLEQLPLEFDFEMLVKMRPKQEYDALRAMIYRWKKAGIIEQVEKNRWHKTSLLTTNTQNNENR